MLANMFSGRWDDSIPKDPEGRFFIDQEYSNFEPLIRYLRDLNNNTETTEEPSPPQKDKSFCNMVEYYRMTSGVFKIACVTAKYNGFGQRRTVGVYPNITISSGEEMETFWLEPSNGHSRHVKSFEVTMGPHSHVQIGWISSNHIGEALEDQDDDELFGVGYAKNSAAFDSTRSGLMVDGICTLLRGGFVKEGTVVRCEDRGMIWRFDGEAQVSTTSLPVSGTVQIKRIWQNCFSDRANHLDRMRPCLTLKGSCQITCIELE